MSLEKALAVVRREHPNDLIWDGFEVDGKWYFMHTRGRNFTAYDGSGMGLVVDGDQCQYFYEYWAKIWTDARFNEAYANRRPIDVDHGRLIRKNK